MHEAYPVRKGSDLAELRRHLGVEQKAIAARLGITPTSVYRWEQAETCPPIRWARYFAAAEAELRAAAEAVS